MNEKVSIFANRILNLMEKHEISMSDALQLDFEESGFSVVETMNEMLEFAEETIETEFKLYLLENGLTPKNGAVFLDIFMGRTADVGLTKLNGKS